ncbi:hybrid sensor histidine kinase/response regulator [Larkinella soli]|uniref:hybrid sensor histidine kinase/response regulator n=1 Tax=Larkinella soli TaxID=1770527 RepID=UPI000FFBA792|nr:response regulator [Larkinella soli]
METQILLIEDEMQIRENISELLTLNGFRVETAANGRDGISQAMLHPPDLILCDIMMPEVDGYQVLDVIRGNRSLANVPFIFLTAKTDAVNLRRGMVLGADDYLTKPFTFQALLNTIESRMKRESQRKADLQARLAEQRGTIASMAAHEYNTCLNGILGFSSLLIDQYQAFNEEELLSMVEMIRVSGTRLKRSLDNIRLMDDLQHLNPESPAYDYYVGGSSLISAELFPRLVSRVEYRQGREMLYRYEVETARLRISADNLAVCLEELVDNAVKFSEPNGLVHLSGVVEGECYRFTATNQGQSFQTGDLDRIAPYTQFDRSRYEQQGFGLGLSILKQILKLNGGSLKIESRGDRTEVSIRLPVAA